MWRRDPHQVDGDTARVWAGDLQETERLALCYDADVLQDLIVSRTCACALDRKGASGLNDLRPITRCLPARVGASRPYLERGDDLPDENLLAGVERLGHDAQEFLP